MDKAITQFLDNLVNKCLSSPVFSSLPEDEKGKVKEKLKNHFYNITFDLLVDNLNEQQLNQVKDLDAESEEMADKLQLFATQIPGFIFTLEQKLKDEAAKISQTGHVPA